jgi:hypothetical protein
MRDHPVITAFAVLALIFAAFIARDYLPGRPSVDVQRYEQQLADARKEDASKTARLKAAEQELEHTHRLAVETDAPLKRDSLAYEYAKRHLDTTSIDSLKKQVRRADTVIVDQRNKIRALEADTASKAVVIMRQRALLLTKDDEKFNLEKVNEGIRQQIPSTGQKFKHDAKVIGFTLSAVGLVAGIVAVAR